MQNIIDLIKSIDTAYPNINPTVIYNEGWMTRLLVQQSIKEKLVFNGLDFGNISNWTSEALISSPFINAQTYREGYTHADIALGDFDVDYTNRGEIKIRKDAKLFGIIEAKMGSDLSQGTTHVKDYNQASRNLACIAHNTFSIADSEIFFWVASPEKKILKHNINGQIDLPKMIQQIKQRFGLYQTNEVVRKDMIQVIDKALKCKINTISYEEWIKNIKDNIAKCYIDEFYDKALTWNRIKK